MKLRVLIGTLVFLIVVNLATIGTFIYLQLTRPEQPPAPLPAERPGEPPYPAMLDGGERRQLMRLFRNFQEETADSRRLVRGLESELIAVMQAESVSSTEVDSLLELIFDARFEISRQATRKLIEAREVLSPRQRELFYRAILDARPGGGDGDGWRQRGRGRHRRSGAEQPPGVR